MNIALSRASTELLLSRATKRNGSGWGFEQTSGRAKRAIWGGKHILSGNNVSFSNRHTRRTWQPNVHRKRFWSPLLQKSINTKVTAYALRCIEKAGGIDHYILLRRKSELDPGLSQELRVRMRDHLYKTTGRRINGPQGMTKRDVKTYLDSISPYLRPVGTLPKPQNTRQDQLDRNKQKELDAEAEVKRQAQEWKNTLARMRQARREERLAEAVSLDGATRASEVAPAAKQTAA